MRPTEVITYLVLSIYYCSIININIINCSRREVQSFLTEIGVKVSRNKWRRIFREFDRNGDDDISTEEMLHFLFDSVAPEHEANKLHMVCMFVYYSL